MANIAREGNEIVLKLSSGERILAVHRDVRVPLPAVKSVEVVNDPIRRIQGLKPRNFKVFGGYWPGWFAYGSFSDGAVRLLGMPLPIEPAGCRDRAAVQRPDHDAEQPLRRDAADPP